MHTYPTDLTDNQWLDIQEFIDKGRKRELDLRQMVNAVLYVVKTGCQWRMLPLSYPKWQSVYYYFQCWKHGGVIEAIQHKLVKEIRVIEQRNEQPTVGIVDAQSVKATFVNSKKIIGYDGGKKVKGIKRQIITDTLGLLLCIVVTSASVADRKGGAMVAETLKPVWNNIVKLFADGGYSLVGQADQLIQELGSYILEIVPKDKSNTFKVLPKRWIVERTFAWIETNRRNAKFYEKYTSTAEAMARLSAIRMMLDRKHRKRKEPLFKNKNLNKVAA